MDRQNKLLLVLLLVSQVRAQPILQHASCCTIGRADGDFLARFLWLALFVLMVCVCLSWRGNPSHARRFFIFFFFLFFLTFGINLRLEAH